jgi:signal peptidase I
MRTRLLAGARAVRLLLTVAWLVTLVGLIGLAGWSHLTEPVIVAGTSMAPAMPVGSLVTLEPVAPDRIRTGDVVSVRADNGVLVTHRVVRIAELPAGRHLELRGDANPHPDPVLVPADAVVGRVDRVVPLAGYVVAMLASAVGLVAIVAFLAAALMAIWLLEELDDLAVEGAMAGPERPRAAGDAHATR